MDERVYEIVVCPCGAQRAEGGDQAFDPCHECGAPSTDAQTLRLIVGRNAVLGQVNPHRYVVENAVYFGCWRESGHYYWGRGPHGGVYKLNGWDTHSPWGGSIDGGLFPRYGGPTVEGEAHVFHKDGWTALAFPDRSVDTRPGSWSVFCLPATYDGPEALEIAREAFPEIFARYGFEVTLA